MKLNISSASGKPIYEQIEDQIRAAIMSGELQTGEALPSLRKLAKELHISVLTIARAYSELADEGLVENVQGKGTFVMERGNELMKERARERIMDKLREVSIEPKPPTSAYLICLACSRKRTGNNHERFLTPPRNAANLGLERNRIDEAL